MTTPATDSTADPTGAPGGVDTPPVRDRTPALDPALSPPEDTSPTGEAEPETFDRAYVQKLRDEAAGHRVKAKRADALSAALVTAHAASLGRLADATDFPFSDDLLDEDGMPDPAKVSTSVDELLTRKPHLAARRPTGDVGQGARAEADDFSLSGLLRRGA